MKKTLILVAMVCGGLAMVSGRTSRFEREPQFYDRAASRSMRVTADLPTPAVLEPCTETPRPEPVAVEPVSTAPSARVDAPLPSAEVARDADRLSHWLLHELSDEDFARVEATPEMDGYVAQVCGRVLGAPCQDGQPSAEARAFFDRLNERVRIARSQE